MTTTRQAGDGPAAGTALTPAELDRYAPGDRLTPDEMRDMRRRATSAPRMWIVQESVAAGPRTAPPASPGPRGCHFVHRPTGTRYTFAFAPRANAWYKRFTPAQEEWPPHAPDEGCAAPPDGRWHDHR